MNTRYAMASHRGLVRENNEDSARVVPELELYIVADGMGGHAGGEVASQVAAEAMAEAVASQFPPPRVRDQCELMQRAIQAANAAVLRESSARDLAGRGTTLTAPRVTRNTATLAHVGDSRAYLVTPRRLQQLTTDQTVVWTLYLEGAITREQIADHPDRHLLVQAIGSQPDVAPQVLQRRIPKNGRFLLCSDGLHDQVTSKDIKRLALGTDLQEAANALTEAANAAGGIDNTTALLVAVD